MSETLLVELNPPRVEVEPGGPSAEVIVGLHNLGNAVEQFTTEIQGLEPDWFTAPSTNVGLFPQDRNRVAIAFHPPRRPGLRAGAYPFRVLVRAKDGEIAESIDGVLDVQGIPTFRLVLSPHRRSSRKPGEFRLHISNTGTMDIRLRLEAKDPEATCTFRFPKGDSPFVPAGGKLELPLTVQANDRPWVGQGQSHKFAVTAIPLEERGEPQTATGEYVYQPLFASWRPVQQPIQLVLLFVFLFTGAQYLTTSNLIPRLPRSIPSVKFSYDAFCASGMLGSDCSGADQLPDPDTCVYAQEFKGFHDAYAKLLGNCITPVSYDEMGNGIQYTDKGWLLLVKQTDILYFFSGDQVLAFDSDTLRWIDGPPLAPAPKPAAADAPAPADAVPADDTAPAANAAPTDEPAS
jgi:hypothetical protein